MKPTRIILVRHGITEWNEKELVQGLSDIELSQSGLKQARKVATRLARMKFDFIYSSPLKRASETAEIIARHHNCKIIHTSLLIERNMGELEGKCVEGLYEYWNNPRKRPRNGENIYDIRKRISPFLDSLLKKHKGKTILIVSHGTTAKVMLCHLTGIPLSKSFVFRLANTSITEVELGNHGPRVVRLNDHSHLE